MTTDSRHQNNRTDRMDLRYTPTARDFREAHRAHARSTRAGRRRLAVTLVLTVAVMAVGIRGGSVTVLSLLMGAAYLFFALVFLPRAQAGRAAARAAEGGGQRVRIDPTGVRVTAGGEQRRFAWPEIARHLETPRLFLLIGADRDQPCLAVLPKEGSGDRLRALLETRSHPARPN
ncbi:YcxB family protein [Streptomyces sp. UH6]|uniref:YcxB family protein n=1 Tax=Streptomyces sp. UH6 TaxID=2748379 RepID=UPI0015D4E2BB|nr:YcxB family protein [Streptomyces sp. UH6]NYV74690.1 YcxB family protein [Streptomyces sp. UH6]